MTAANDDAELQRVKTLTAEQVAELLQCTTETLYARVQRGEIPGRVFDGGRLLRFKRPVVVAWLSEESAKPERKRR